MSNPLLYRASQQEHFRFNPTIEILLHDTRQPTLGIQAQQLLQVSGSHTEQANKIVKPLILPSGDRANPTRLQCKKIGVETEAMCWFWSIRIKNVYDDCFESPSVVKF